MAAEPDASFAAWVRELRRRLGLTQAELGQRVGRAKSSVHQWETGRYDADREVRGRLSGLAAAAGLGPPPPGPAPLARWGRSREDREG
jgi:transcriptional regulator with XRE-family HTH domain